MAMMHEKGTPQRNEANNLYCAVNQAGGIS